MNLLNLLLAWLPPVLWAGLIYWFSSMPSLSSGLEMDLVLRKAAHITEYFILTWLLLRAFRTTSRSSSRWPLAASGAIALVYAMSDEFHQSFVAGRQGSVPDVFIDSLGILVCLFWFARRRVP